MAEVYRAKLLNAPGFERFFAIKRILPHLAADTDFVTMFINEAKVAVELEHPNVCQIYELGRLGQSHYIAMEFIAGRDVLAIQSHYRRQRKIMSVSQACFIIAQAAQGLDYAHKAVDSTGNPLGLVHRDVSPQNLIVAYDGVVKLIDFGVSKASRRASNSQSGVVKGKFSYMSPEQARGDRVDQRADVFALGAVLYEMLCGHMLYPLSIDDMRLRTKTRMADFVPIETYLPNIPEKLRLIVAKALARDINQRFASSRDFLLALTQFFHDGCKVYDSINLSLLVEKYLAQKSKNEAISSEQRKKVSLRNEIRSSDPLVDASDTTIMNADAARRIALGTPLGEMYPTAVYAQPAFQEHPANSPSPLSADCSVARSVDLSISSPGNESTVMVNMKDVKGRKTNAFEFVSEAFANASAYFNQKIQMMSEKTLAIIAVSLTFLLVVVIIIIFVQFREVPPPSDSIDNAVERVQDADTAPSTDD